MPVGENYCYNLGIILNHYKDKELVNILGGVMLVRLIQQQYNPSKESVTAYILQALQTEEISQQVLITKILQLNNAIHEQNPEIQVQGLLDNYNTINSYDYEPEALIAILIWNELFK